MTELQEITFNKTFPELFRELKFQRAQGESGQIISHVKEQCDKEAQKLHITYDGLLYNIIDNEAKVIEMYITDESVNTEDIESSHKFINSNWGGYTINDVIL